MDRKISSADLPTGRGWGFGFDEAIDARASVEAANLTAHTPRDKSPGKEGDD
jgi:hypothetical protein